MNKRIAVFLMTIMSLTLFNGLWAADATDIAASC